MQIPPSIISGHNGFQSAQSDLTQATVDVASSSQSVSSTTTVDSSDSQSALISATHAVSHAQASAEVIEASSETIGTLINIEV
ncbi:chemotaxis protein [Shewanella sp. GutDb-MelDb]|uniref:chemotaxis protein n=1 Tax=Shewanella sp. GutDb-MelDb TaxID=2058316 RepID=UPI000C7BBFC7|nr:chemotaxis protein [Shewanella sp. GutDb-MelDb]PKG58960.1 chemotaxis protein [Shewanella sp. GutDb-MelDb]